MAIKIFIDQGHNPTNFHNAGAQGFGLYEQDITYQVGIYLANLLSNDPRFSVQLSRPYPTTVLGTDNTSSLAARTRMANEWPADYFISIHCNANDNPAVRGTEVYIYQYYTQANWLAEQVMEGITSTVGTKNNGIYENKALFLLRNVATTSILVELAYLTNESDAILLRDDQYQFAYGMYLGIMRYFGFL